MPHLKLSKLAAVAGFGGAACQLLAVAGLVLKGFWPSFDFQFLWLYGTTLGIAALPLGLAALYTTRAGALRRGAALAWLGCIAGALQLAALLAFAFAPH